MIGSDKSLKGGWIKDKYTKEKEKTKLSCIPENLDPL